MALGHLQARLPPSPAKSRYSVTGGRASLPHQPWSYHSGVRVPGYPRTFGPSAPPRFVGDGIPSVTSIDEGVELTDISSEESSELVSLRVTLHACIWSVHFQTCLVKILLAL